MFQVRSKEPGSCYSTFGVPTFSGGTSGCEPREKTRGRDAAQRIVRPVVVVCVKPLVGERLDLGERAQGRRSRPRCSPGRRRDAPEALPPSRRESIDIGRPPGMSRFAPHCSRSTTAITAITAISPTPIRTESSTSLGLRHRGSRPSRCNVSRRMSGGGPKRGRTVVGSAWRATFPGPRRGWVRPAGESPSYAARRP